MVSSRRRFDDVRHARLCRRWRSGKDAAASRHNRPQERSHCSAMVAQRLRSRGPQHGRQNDRSGNVERPGRSLTSKTAMATGQINITADGNPFTLEQYVAAAHKHGVPVALDVADRLPLTPNPYLSRGVDLVAY